MGKVGEGKISEKKKSTFMRYLRIMTVSVPRIKLSYLLLIVVPMGLRFF